MTADDAFAKWPGGKFRSGLLQSDAQDAFVTWIFFLDDPETPQAQLGVRRRTQGGHYASTPRPSDIE